MRYPWGCINPTLGGATLVDQPRKHRTRSRDDVSRIQSARALGGPRIARWPTTPSIARLSQRSPTVFSVSRLLSTPVHKFGNVFCYAATEGAGTCLSSFCISTARSFLVNRHSNGVAMRS